MDGILCVSPPFDADTQPEGVDWYLFEVLLRFFFAAIGEYKIGKCPNDRMADRPKFVKRYYEEQNPEMKKMDKDADWGGIKDHREETR